MHKLVLGSLLVAAAAVAFPTVLAGAGVGLSPWLQTASALCAGGTLGFFLSRRVAERFASLSQAVDRVGRGDFARVDDRGRQPTFPDETWELEARSFCISSLPCFGSKKNLCFLAR